MSAKKAARRSEPTFAEARARLDEILEALEREADDVDQLAARIKEASELIRLCRERLSAARHEVKEVVAELAADTQAPAGSDDDGDEELVEEEAFDEDAEEAGGTLPF